LFYLCFFVFFRSFFLRLGRPPSPHLFPSRPLQLRVWADREEIEARRADWALACLQAAMR